MPKSIEEKAGITYTTNDVVETRVNLKINKNGSSDDADAYDMLEYLRKKNINVSKHIRLLLALEYRGEIYLNPKHQVIGLRGSSNDSIKEDELEPPIAVTLQENNTSDSFENIEDMNYIKYDENEDAPPPDDNFL